jgi:hypothetical protein
MRVALCYPPDVTVPTAPFGSLPLLQACLKRAGHQVVPLDLAILTFHWLIRRENLAQFYQYAGSTTDASVRASFASHLANPRGDRLRRRAGRTRPARPRHVLPARAPARRLAARAGRGSSSSR